MGIDEQINYNIDTSIVIQSNKTKDVFYNGVGNPYLKTINKKNLFQKILIKILL